MKLKWEDGWDISNRIGLKRYFKLSFIYFTNIQEIYPNKIWPDPSIGEKFLWLQPQRNRGGEKN